MAQPIFLGSLVVRYSIFTGAPVDSLDGRALLVAFIAAWFGSAVLQSVAGFVNASVLQELRVVSKRILFHHVLTQSRHFFMGAGAGDIESRMSTASMCTRGLYVELLSSLLRFFGLTVFALWAFSQFHWTLALFYFAWLIIYLPVSLYTSNTAPRLAGLAVNATARVTGFMVDVIANSELVRAAEAQDREVDKASELLDAERRYYLEGQIVVERAILIRRCLLFVLVCGMASIVWWGVANARMPPSSASIVMFVTLVLSFQLEAIGQSLLSIREYFHRLAQSLHGLDYTTKRLVLNEGSRCVQVTPLEQTGVIVLTSVRFGYGSKPPILNNLNLCIQQGEKVGLVGPSGSGKSTLLNLIRGELQPSAGRILLNIPSHDSGSNPASSSVVAYVSQDIPTLNRTLRENLLYGVERQVSDLELHRTMCKVGLGNLVETIEGGLDGILGERGAKLSGGERQRIALVRALIRNVPIILLDEPTSALDSTNERLVDEIIGALPIDKTVLVVSHHVTGLKSLGRIVTLEAEIGVTAGDSFTTKSHLLTPTEN